MISGFVREVDYGNCPCLIYYAGVTGYSLPLLATCTYTFNVSCGLRTRGGKTRIYFGMYLIYMRGCCLDDLGGVCVVLCRDRICCLLNIFRDVPHIWEGAV